jgi:uncharacterized protein with HEPN domain
MASVDDLETILRLIGRIERTVAGETAESFEASQDAIDAVAYRLGMIGEHCKRLPQDVRDRHPDVPWRAMVGLRTIVAHSYDTVSASIVWRTAADELAPVREMAEAERRRLRDGND